MSKYVVKFLLIIMITVSSTMIGCDTMIAKASSKTSTQEKVEINVGDKKQLKIKGIKEPISWNSLNKKIAVVSSKGIVTGKSYGKTTVTGKTKSRTYQFSIQVNSNYDFSFDEESITLSSYSFHCIGLRVNFSKDGKPVDPPEDVQVTSSNEKIYKVSNYKSRNCSLIIYLDSDLPWDDQNINESAEICLEYEGKKVYCKVNIVPVSSMSIEDYCAAENSKYLWQYLESVYIIDAVNNYDILCDDYGYNIYFRLSTGEEFYGSVHEAASNGVTIWSDMFIPKDLTFEEISQHFISKNYDFRLFYLSDEILSSGTRNQEKDSLERMFTYHSLYVKTGEITEDGAVVYTLEPNHSSGTIVYFRVWVQVENDDLENYGISLPKDGDKTIPKDYVVTDWGKKVSK